MLYLLLGLLEPDEGEILIDGSPLTSSNMRLWQNTLGYVPQHIKLTEGTVLENIAFGIPANRIDKTRAIEVAIAAGIDSFITSDLPDQYETVVGDGGVLLSGGQKQRIGIARSLYHNPTVLLLDESTNELDDETESRILQQLSTIINLTIVFISHKQSVQKHADSVLLLSTPNRRAENRYSNG
jgi:ATP-binding cassette subfamily C protein